MLPLFQAPPTAGPDRTVPDIMDAPIEELEDWSRGASRRYLQSQRNQLGNFVPCETYNLADHIHDLPEIFQGLARTMSDDRQIHFRVEPVMQTNGLTVPEVRFFRMATAGTGSGPRTTITVDTSSGVPNTSFRMSGSGGAAVLTNPNELSFSDTAFGGPREPFTPPTETPLLRFGVGLGGAAAMYALIEPAVSRLPRGYQAPAFIGLSSVGYSALYNTSELMVERGLLARGFMGAPQWGQMAQTAPHMFLVGAGFSGLYRELGVTDPRANGWMTFLSSTGVYMGAPSIAADYPAVGAAFNSSIGVGLTPLTIGQITAADGTLIAGSGYEMSALGGRIFLAGDGIAGGAGVMGGVFQAAGAVAIPLIGNFVTDTVWSIGRGDSGEEDLFWTAWDGSLSEFLGNGFIAGSLGRFMQLIQVYGGGLREGGVIDDSVHTMYDRYLSDTGSSARHVQDSLRSAVIVSLEEGEGENGQFRINWDTFEANVGGIYASRPDSLRALYNAVSLLRNSAETSSRVSQEARELTNSFGSDGHLRASHPELQSFLLRIFRDADSNSFVNDNDNNQIITDSIHRLLGSERDALAQRAMALGIPLDRRVHESELTQTQRAFMHGDGVHPSEMLNRRRHIQTLRHLLDRFEREPALQRPSLQTTWFNETLAGMTAGTRAFTLPGGGSLSIRYFERASGSLPPDGYHEAFLGGSDRPVLLDDHNYQRFTDYLIRNEAAQAGTTSIPARFNRDGIPQAVTSAPIAPSAREDSRIGESLGSIEDAHPESFRIEEVRVDANPAFHALTIPDSLPEAERNASMRVALQNGLTPHRIEGRGQVYWTTPLGWQSFMERGGRIQAATLVLPPGVTR